jgi:DNA-binding Lrp family transcriptional regulator
VDTTTGYRQLDELDMQIVNALQVDGRAAFSAIASVLDVSDQTVARRYRRLRGAGVLRVVGLADTERTGLTAWYLRLRCTPDAAGQVGVALARRPDTAWVQLLSGGTEVTCAIRSVSRAATDELVLEKLPRLSRVVGVTAHCLIHMFLGGAEDWIGMLGVLTDEQVAALALPAAAPVTPEQTLSLTADDRLLLNVLAKDGRTGYADLATAIGWSETTVRRRVDELRSSGAVRFEVELNAASAGYQAEAMLWMSVAPHSLAAVGAALADHAETAFVAATTGPTNLVATVVCRNAEALYTYLTERVGRLEAINQLESALILRTIKREGAVLPH